MFSRSRFASRALILTAVAAAVALGHACTEDPAGPNGSVEAPANVVIEVLSFNRIRVQWQNVAGAAGYLVERRTDLTGEFRQIAEVTASAGANTSFVDSDVKPKTFYGYRVRTSGGLAGKSSGPSEIVGARTPSEPGIEVTISMNAPDPTGADPNGFRLRIAGPQNVAENVAAGVVALVTPLTAGTYTVTLEDVAATCAVVGGPSRTVTVTGQGAQTIVSIAFSVICRDSSKGGIVVAVTAAGDTSDTDGVIARVIGTAGGATVITDTLRVASGQTASTQKLELLTLTPGSYEVTLTDVNASICRLAGSPTVTRNVVAVKNDTVRFNMTCSKNQAPRAEANGPYTGLVNAQISFSSAGSSDADGNIATFSWNFGDGSNGTGASPTHAYTTAGSYTVRLTVTDNVGATNTDSASVTVNPGFAWRNKFSDDSVQAGDKVFLDVTTKPGLGVSAAEGRISYNTAALRLDSIEADPHWSTFTRTGTTPGTAAFQASVGTAGDASVETPVATLHFTVVGAPGAIARTTTRNIVLKNGGGTPINITGLSVTEDTVTILNGGNRPPVAKVNASVPFGMTGATITFSAQPGTADPDGSIVSYVWNLGDGTLASGPITQKKYNTPGTYIVKLTVTDNSGATASDSIALPVQEADNVPPTADAGGPYTGVVGSALKFTGAGSRDSDGRIVRFDWQFGDGSTASGPDSVAFRTYNAAGNYIVALTVIDNRGGIASDTARVTITPLAGSNRPPVAEANGPYSGTAGLPVSLRATGTTDPDNNIKSYTWYYPDTTTTTGLNTLKTFARPGAHAVTLVVEDSLGLLDTDTTTVVITTAGQANQAPIARANGPYITRTNLPLAFSSAGTRDPDGWIVSYKWNFGDGSSSTDTTIASPTHVYTTAGTYSVSLLVTDNRGASAVDVTAVTVLLGVAPVAHAGGPYSGTSGNAITFDGSRSVDVDGTITAYAWDFGDGTVVSGLTTATTTHTYATAGSYSVRLTVTDNHGFTASASSTATIVGPPVNALPVARANGPYSGFINNPISFSAAGSVDPDGTIASFAWSFGDGGSATGASTTHSYTSAGQFMVVLTVTDNRGATDTDTAQVTVSASPANNPPIAKANGPATGSAGTALSFTSAGSSDSDGNIVSYAWNFGDGGSAVGQNVTHTFAASGTFAVKLTVTDNLGATGTDSVMVTITGGAANQKPVAKANGPYSGNAGSSISFSSAGSQDPDGSIASYAWNFGDGSTGTGQSATHVYAAAGTFTAVLTVTDNLGATDPDTAIVTILPAGTNTPPTANTGGPYNGVVGTPLTLNGSGTDNGTITAYAWDLDNDGAFDDASIQNPQFTCTAGGTNTIRLQVTDNGTPPLTGVASTSVTCTTTAPPPAANTIRGRWVNASGAAVTSVTAGSTVFLELDALLGAGKNMHDFQGVLQFSAARLNATNQGADLNCSNPGGQATCPSGSPAAGNTDVMNQYTGNNSTPGQISFLNFSNNANSDLGTGIQGLGRMQFTASSAGTVTLTLVVQISVNGAGADLNLAVSLPTLTIN